MKSSILKSITPLLFGVVIALSSCQKEVVSEFETETANANNLPTTTNALSSNESVLLVIDEQSIANDLEPNYFSDVDVNDNFSALGQRQTLRYFGENVGDTITLFTGEVGDEGWHAFTSIPAAWKLAGPTTNGALNFLQAGPGLGSGNDPEALLDKIANVAPLRAMGLAMLTGKTVLAVVYDGNIGTNYAPLDASLKGETLGMVAMQVLSVKRRTGGSSGSLPSVTVKIVSVEAAAAAPLKVFSNAPRPISSSIPFNIAPPAVIPTIVLSVAQ